MLVHEAVYPNVVVAAGTPIGVPLAALRRGLIRKLSVVQLTGTRSGFTYTLYTTAGACQPDGSALAGFDERLYRIAAPFVVASGADSYAGTFPGDGVHNLDLAYGSLDDRDGNVPDPTRAVITPSPTNQAQKIYLKIASAGAGTFGVALAITDPMI